MASDTPWPSSKVLFAAKQQPLHATATALPVSPRTQEPRDDNDEQPVSDEAPPNVMAMKMMKKKKKQQLLSKRQPLSTATQTQESSEEDRMAIMAAVAMTELLAGSKPFGPTSMTMSSPLSQATPLKLSMMGNGEMPQAAAATASSASLSVAASDQSQKKEQEASREDQRCKRKVPPASAPPAISISPDNSSLEDGNDVNFDDDDDENSCFLGGSHGQHRSRHHHHKRSRVGSIGEESPVRKLTNSLPAMAKSAVPHGSLFQGAAHEQQQHQPCPHGSLPPPHHSHSHYQSYRHGPAMYPPHKYGLPPPLHNGLPYGHGHPGHNPYAGHYPPQALPSYHPSQHPHQQHHMNHHPHFPLSHLQSYKETIRVSGLPKSLSFRKICSKCGRTRAEHGELGFGNKCTFSDCGKCGASCLQHSLHSTKMGILCTMTVEQGATPGASEAYDRKIRALAARAEIQKTLLEDKKERTAKLAHHMVARAEAKASSVSSTSATATVDA
jgi:hypothetical protein